MTSDRQICGDIPRCISSPGSVSGRSLSVSPGGRTVGRCGARVAPASLSARQAKERGLLMSGTSGPRRSGYYSMASQPGYLSMVSRLRAQTECAGSTLYALTWKLSATPAGVPYWLLRASVRRSSGNGRIGWPAPRAAAACPDYACMVRPESGGISLQTAAALSGWGSPRATDAKCGGTYTTGMTGKDLSKDASLAGWVAPSTRDWKDSPGMATVRPDGRSRLDMLPRQSTLAGWASPQARDHFPAHTAEYVASKRAQGHGMQNLNDQGVLLAGWCAPRAEDAESAGMRHGRGVADTLTAQSVVLSGWPAPMAGSPGTAEYNAAGNTDSSRMTVALCGWQAPGTDSFRSRSGKRKHEMGLDQQARSTALPPGPARLTASGEMLTGCSAGMTSGGQLSPEHSLWLMGIPKEWASCAARAMQSLRKSRRRLSQRLGDCN
jgi:hypothetical protein